MTTADATPTIQGLLDAVERIRPIIEEHAPRGESERRLPDEIYRAMEEAGLFAMLQPRAYGGMEVRPVEAMRAWEAVARIDAASAWNLAMNGANTALAAFLPSEGAQEVMAEGPTTVAGALFPPGQAQRVDGGWRVTGRVPFASGCSNAAWQILPAVAMDGDSPRVDPETGQPVLLVPIFPRSEVEILDTWYTMGMRGSGSADIAVDDVFVPDRRVIVSPGPLTSPAPGFEGPLYRIWPLTAVLGEATVSVGAAAAAVDDMIRLATEKTPAYNQLPLREQSWAQHAAGKALSLVNAARDTIHSAAEDAYEEAATGAFLSWDTKTRLQVAVSFAADAGAEAVRCVYEVAGGSAIRLENGFERYLRDTHTLTQHASKSSPRYASAGRLMFGIENDWVWLSF